MDHPEVETLEGTVSAVIYQNPENGYTVLRVKSKEGSQTVVGELADVSVGETVLATGIWVDHPSFGPQFKASHMETTIPTEQNGIYEYLASGVIKGIGKQTARRIVDRFGRDTLAIIESEPERLAEVKGITPKKARAIQGEFLQKAGMRRLVEFLTEHQLPVSVALAMWRRYADRAIDILRADPYLLLNEDLGVKFADADRVAAACGIGPEDLLRVEAGILYTLQHNLGNGHCFLPRLPLLDGAGRMLRLEDSHLMEEGLDALRLRGRVVLTDVAGVEAVYLSDLYDGEQYIIHRITAMCCRELHPPADLERLIDRVEREQGLTYAPEQRDAVRMAAHRQVMLLTGGPGTGKTTSLRGILGLYEMMGLKTLLCAPTGRAAKRLGELCGTEASTIHRLLEAGYDSESGQLAFQRNEDEPLNCNAVIVDETSMVDVPLMAALLSALPNDCRLVLVGDPDQLPSVGPGQVFDHLIRASIVPNTRLTAIFRQAQESRIIMNAHAVNQGVVPNLKNQGGDFFFLRRKDAGMALETIVELCRTRLPEKMGIPADQIQVLSPTRKYTTGTASLNQALQATLNPHHRNKGERKHGSVVFREGDRVMQIKNNYDVLWRSENGLKGGMGIFNGDVGIIMEITPDGDCVTVNFDGHIVEYTPDMLGELEMAYAMTVHKSQGSEYRAVILAAVSGAPMLLTRGVLYTAITRAKELLIIVGDDEVIVKMTGNDRQTRRYSGIRYLLEQEGAQTEW